MLHYAIKRVKWKLLWKQQIFLQILFGFGIPDWGTKGTSGHDLEWITFIIEVLLSNPNHLFYISQRAVAVKWRCKWWVEWRDGWCNELWSDTHTISTTATTTTTTYKGSAAAGVLMETVMLIWIIPGGDVRGANVSTDRCGTSGAMSTGENYHYLAAGTSKCCSAVAW